LSDIAAVRFIDLGEPEVEQAGHVIEEESTIGRLSRHLVELKVCHIARSSFVCEGKADEQGLPSYIIRFITRLTSSSYSSAVSTTPLSLDRLHRDQFGFQKLVAAVTKGGKLFGLDSANGNIIWSRNLGLFGEKAELEIVDMWTVREFGELGNPTLAVLAIRAGKVRDHGENPMTELILRLSPSTSTASLVLYPATRPTLAYQLARSYSKDVPRLLSSFLSRTAVPRTESLVSSMLRLTYTSSHSARKSLPMSPTPDSHSLP